MSTIYASDLSRKLRGPGKDLSSSPGKRTAPPYKSEHNLDVQLGPAEDNSTTPEQVTQTDSVKVILARIFNRN